MTSRMASAGDAASDDQLITAVRRGNDHAFEQLYRRYSASIERFVAARVRDRGRAEDLVQEIFLSALRRMRATDTDDHLPPLDLRDREERCDRPLPPDEPRRGSVDPR